MLKPGDKISAFSALDQHGKEFRWTELNGAKVVYFYPKDDTPGCTLEACAFRDAYEDFSDAGITVIGISADSPEQHDQFARKYQLPFLLLSDTKGELRQLFGVKAKFLGLIPGRVTFVVDANNVVQHVFDSLLKPEKHVMESLRILNIRAQRK